VKRLLVTCVDGTTYEGELCDGQEPRVVAGEVLVHVPLPSPALSFTVEESE
jgi:hypothetical protein